EEVELPGFRRSEYPLRVAGENVTRRLLHPPAHRVWHGEARALAVVQIDHAPEAGDSLEPMTGGDALAALWPPVFRAEGAAVAGAGGAHADVAGYRLRTARPEEALARALALAAELGVAPA